MKILKLLTNLRRYYEIITIVLLTILVFLSINKSFPYRDSAAFQYGGQQILEGKILYKDFWDHKGPAIHYINAFTRILTPNSRTGLYIVEIFSYLISVVILNLLLKQISSPAIRTICLIMFTTSYCILIDLGNYTEEYALAINFITLYFTYLSTLGAKTKSFLVGILLGLNFLLRPNLIALQLAILIYFAVQSQRKSTVTFLKTSFYSAIGIIIPLFFFIFYFAMHKSLNNFLDAFLVYNIKYSASSLQDKITSIFTITKISFITLLLPSALVGLVYSIQFYIKKRSHQSLMKVICLTLIIEIFAMTASGRSYNHYYIPLLLPLTILAAFGLENFQRTSLWSSLNHLSRFAIIITFVIHSIATTGTITTVVKSIETDMEKRYKVVKYIQNKTNRDEKILVWGNDPGFYVESNRPAASKYFCQYPLYTPQYTTKEILNSFLNDIIKNTPSLILDASGIDPIVPPINCVNYTPLFRSPEYYSDHSFMAIYEYICNNYTKHTSINKWELYLPKNQDLQL